MCKMINDVIFFIIVGGVVITLASLFAVVFLNMRGLVIGGLLGGIGLALVGVIWQAIGSRNTKKAKLRAHLDSDLNLAGFNIMRFPLQQLENWYGEAMDRHDMLALLQEMYGKTWNIRFSGPDVSFQRK